MTSRWSRSAVASIAASPLPAAPVVAGVPRLLPDVDLWDFWPVQEPDGTVARVGGGELYFFLAAAFGDTEERHDRARLHLMHRVGDRWRDLGPAFPDGFGPGSRHWSGSTVVDRPARRLTLYFTAAGRRGERTVGYDQRLFVTAAPLSASELPVSGQWTLPREVVAPGPPYVRAMTGGGAIGTIKAFRDPAWFRDPADGAEYLLFTGSLAASASAWNGVVGLVRRERDAWTLAPPLISADEVNNELERPHVVVHGGRYYCFWSTQAKVFAAGGPAGPTGLYGMVADAFAGPWRPLNGSGLVVANPAAAPHQAYSWLVLADLRVLSFADLVGLPGEPSDAAIARRHFGGTPAPELRLRLDGDRAVIA